MSLWKEFKDFAVKGNAIDLAIGIVIGAAFGKIVDSLVSDMLMPPLGLLLGKMDFSNIFLTLSDGSTPGPYGTLAVAKAAGAVTINLGLFANVLISFLIVSFSVFVLVKGLNTLRKMETVKTEETLESSTKECPFCFSTIAARATRCPDCTSDLLIA